MADSQRNPATSKTEAAKELIVAEYNNLHAELLKRSDIRYQITQFVLTALGVFLTVGLSVKNAILIYSYPALVLALSIIYATNVIESRRIRKYIATYIERRVQSEGDEEPFGWWHYRASQGWEWLSFGPLRLGTLGNVGTKLLFLLCAVVAVVVGKLAPQLYGQDSTVFFWLACILTFLEGILLFGVESQFSFFEEMKMTNDSNTVPKSDESDNPSRTAN